MHISNFIRCYHIAFQSDCVIYPPTMCRVPISIYLPQHLRWSELLKFDKSDGCKMKSNYCINCISFPPITNEMEHLTYVYWAFGFLLRWIVGSYPFPIFLSCSLCFLLMICESPYKQIWFVGCKISSPSHGLSFSLCLRCFLSQSC